MSAVNDVLWHKEHLLLTAGESGRVKQIDTRDRSVNSIMALVPDLS